MPSFQIKYIYIDYVYLHTLHIRYLHKSPYKKRNTYIEVWLRCDIY